MENKLKDRQFIKRALLVAALILFIVYFSQVTAWAKHLWAIAFPLILGFVIAFILNILMKLLEKRYFPNSKRKLVLKTRRPVCMLLAFALIVALVTVVVNLVLPQVMDTLRILADIFPSYVAQITQWFSERQEQWPAIAEWARKSDFTLESISAPLISFATEGVNGIVSSSVSLISALAVGLFNLIVALAFSFYLLLSKERLLAQLKKLQAAFMKRAAAEKLNTLLAVANESFSSFIVGQCTEAIILGVLCMLGMGLLGFPYATPVGIFIGVTSLIPIFGAYLGAAVGLLLIFPIDPIKALLFVIFIIVLQQLEGNLIYPKVVGASIGLPGIWVFAAVMIGGGLAGIVGMLFGVPTAATAYKLLKIMTNKKLDTAPAEEAA